MCHVSLKRGFVSRPELFASANLHQRTARPPRTADGVLWTTKQMFIDSKIVLAVVISSLLGCSDPSTLGPPSSITLTARDIAICAKWRSGDLPISASYWSPGTFDESSDELLRNWYSAQLCAMGEAPLAAPSPGRSRIRFLWLRSFQPGVAVRVEFIPGATELVAIELDGAGGYAPGTVARRMERSLLPEDRGKLQQTLAESDFWNLPTRESRLGLDGAEWIIEVAEHDRYHVVDRWSGGEVETLGLLLLDLSQLEPDPIY